MKPTLIIVDDHVTFRNALKSLSTIENFATVIGEASNGVEFLELLNHQKPDLVLMDIDMPAMNGIEATQEALKLMPDLKIIALTMFGDEEYYNKMVESGVKGFILKTGGIHELEKAIHNVICGKIYFSEELKKRFIKKK
jgi:DNA-binding NarL/FixJ family response regulator